MIHTGAPGFDDLATTVARTVEELRPHVRKFDSIIVTGISGLSVGAPVALALGKPLVVRRKDKEESHGRPGELINKHRLGKRVLFLDDFISIGRTYARCWQSVEAHGAKVVGAYSYAFGNNFGKPDERFEHWGPRGKDKPNWARVAEHSAQRPGWL